MQEASQECLSCTNWLALPYHRCPCRQKMRQPFVCRRDFSMQILVIIRRQGVLATTVQTDTNAAAIAAGKIPGCCAYRKNVFYPLYPAPPTNPLQQYIYYVERAKPRSPTHRGQIFSKKLAVSLPTPTSYRKPGSRYVQSAKLRKICRGPAESFTL